jgi:DNA-binding transcriptional LysR family regulator
VADLTLVGLRVVAEVARTGSFSAAAERLGYTQSAISRQVAVTEKVAGSPLFIRHARGVRPTAAGEALVRHASKVLDSVTAASQELAGMRDRLAGRLVVGGFPTATAALVPRAIARLLSDHPGLTVQIMETPTPAQLLALRRRRLEVAVLATGDGLPEHDLDGLRLSGLRSGRGAGVAVADTHPFAVRDWVDSQELAGQPWVVGASVGDSLEFGAWPGIEKPRVSFAAHDWPTRLGLVAAGLGIALVPGFAAEAVPHGVRWIPIRDQDGGLRRQLWAATAADPGPAASAMVRALQDEVTELGPARLPLAPARQG